MTGCKPGDFMAKLCFGGSFNPIHMGHLICARYAAERLGFESVVLIPSSQPPHKPQSAHLAAAEHRVRMCELAIGGQGGFEVNALETQRTGPSYTIQTARELVGQGFGKVNWLIGADMLPTLPSWHEPDALLQEVDFVVLNRAGWSIEWETIPDAVRERLRNRVVEAPLIDISATEIRRRVAGGLPIDFLTPAPVVQYIRETGLYRS
jgi:nicotinate-nucleotide adenylyltransferase